MDYRNPHAPADASGDNTPMADDVRSLDGDVDDVEDVERLAESNRRHQNGGTMAMEMDGAADIEEPEQVEEAKEANAELGAEIIAAKAASKSPAPPALETKVEEASNASQAGVEEDVGGGDEMQIDAEDSAPRPTAASPLPESAAPEEVTSAPPVFAPPKVSFRRSRTRDRSSWSHG